MLKLKQVKLHKILCAEKFEVVTFGVIGLKLRENLNAVFATFDRLNNNKHYLALTVFGEEHLFRLKVVLHQCID